MDQAGQSSHTSVTSSSISGSLSYEYGQFQSATQQQITVLQRMCQELRESFTTEQNKTQEIQREINLIKKKKYILPERIGNLQKLPAKLADENFSLKKLVDRQDIATKKLKDETDQKFKVVKTTIETLANTIKETSPDEGTSRSGGVAEESPFAITSNFAKQIIGWKTHIQSYAEELAKAGFRFQNQVQHQMGIFQSRYHELKNLSQRNLRNIFNLQKNVAKTTDENEKLKRAIESQDIVMRKQKEETEQEINALKGEMASLTNAVGETRTSGMTGGAAVGIALPENIPQVVNVLEPQMESYDMRLAEIDLRLLKNEDENEKLKRAIENKDIVMRNQKEETEQEMIALKGEIASLTNALEEMRTRGMSEGAAAGIAVPENFPQIVNVLEPQMESYDMRLAEIDLRFSVLETNNYNDGLIWKIPDFERKVKDAKQGSTIYTQPLYEFGYKMCLAIFLNKGTEIDKNTHMSLYFVLMKGEYDADLLFPFTHKVKLFLLDRSPDKDHLLLGEIIPDTDSSSSFEKPISNMNIAMEFPMCVLYDQLKKYVLDDMIEIRAVIGTTS